MNSSILTLVTFLPAIGALALMLMPRNDRALRWAALIISIVTFALSFFCRCITTTALPVPV
jgi:NADH:ubiquinone oxidoreductase subunit 4 (chain M)